MLKIFNYISFDIVIDKANLLSNGIKNLSKFLMLSKKYQM